MVCKLCCLHWIFLVLKQPQMQLARKAQSSCKIFATLSKILYFSESFCSKYLMIFLLLWTRVVISAKSWNSWRGQFFVAWCNLQVLSLITTPVSSLHHHPIMQRFEGCAFAYPVSLGYISVLITINFGKHYLICICIFFLNDFGSFLKNCVQQSAFLPLFVPQNHGSMQVIPHLSWFLR